MNRCLCGCNHAPALPTSLYAPGHDARHAADVAATMLETNTENRLDELPSEALREQARRIRDNRRVR